MKNFEMANADDPKGLIIATQKAVITAMQRVVGDLKKDNPSVPGLTWEQIEYLFEGYKNREPIVITQTEAM